MSHCRMAMVKKTATLARTILRTAPANGGKVMVMGLERGMLSFHHIPVVEILPGFGGTRAKAKYGGPSTSPSTRCAPSGSGRDDVVYWDGRKAEFGTPRSTPSRRDERNGTPEFVSAAGYFAAGVGWGKVGVVRLAAGETATLRGPEGATERTPKITL